LPLSRATIRPTAAVSLNGQNWNKSHFGCGCFWKNGPVLLSRHLDSRTQNSTGFSYFHNWATFVVYWPIVQ
jgi:hypothetical protein